MSDRGVCCLFGCWFGCRRRVARGRGSCWLWVSAVHSIAFRGVPFQAVLCCSEPGHVVSELVVFAVCPSWLFCLVDIAGLHFAMGLVQRPIVAFGSHSGLFPVCFALPEDPWFDPVCWSSALIVERTM